MEARDAMLRLHRAVTALSGIADAETAASAILDEAAKALGASQARLSTGAGSDLDGTAVAETARTRTALWVEAELAFVCLPLVVEERLLGVATFTFDHARTFSPDERVFAELIAHHAAQALERARLHGGAREVLAQAEEQRRRSEFLGRASAVLAESLDFTRTLQTVATLAVPDVGDWCAVEMVPEDGGPSVQLAVAHVDPAKIALANDLRRRYPPDADAPSGVQAVLRTGKAELYPAIPDEMLVAGAKDAEHLRIIRELDLHSAMVVPIRAHGRTLGAITFVGSAPGRYGPSDLAMAQELADRAGLAIANARLYGAAQRAVALRDEFLAIAGHELKTPLTALSLHAEALHRLSAQGPTEKLVGRAAKAHALVDRLTRLVDELLDVSRITSGRLRLQREAVDLGGLVDEMTARLADHDPPIDVRVSVAEPITGRWDRLRIEQILDNLLTNAMKYGQGGPIEVAVARSGDRAILTVRDHGMGISKADQERIFERFERAVSEHKYGGFGLGLWIVRQVIEAHGGSISVDSEPGQGSTFRVELPMS
jgi:signal transduction histidine kinase